MKQLVEFMARSLVNRPDEVTVTEVETDHQTVYQIRVAEEDMGKIIGKQGRVANALRILTKAAAIKHGKRVQVDILD